MIGSLHTEQRGANFLKEEREFWLDIELKHWQTNENKRKEKVQTDSQDIWSTTLCDLEQITFLPWVSFLS